MNKRNIIKILIFLVTASLGVVKTYGYAEVEQAVLTAVQPAVAVSKATSLTESGTVNALNGSHPGLQTNFIIQTNGKDYEFIMKSSIDIEGEKISAYGIQGNQVFLLFGHTLTKPTLTDVENAKAGGNKNNNVIAYPVTSSITSPMKIDFAQNYGVHGDCYVVNVNNGTEGTVTHTVGGTPISGTYNIGQDQAGTYQAVVTLSAVTK